jgi:hypothetical protein
MLRFLKGTTANKVEYNDIAVMYWEINITKDNFTLANNN